MLAAGVTLANGQEGLQRNFKSRVTTMSNTLISMNLVREPEGTLCSSKESIMHTPPNTFRCRPLKLEYTR